MRSPGPLRDNPIEYKYLGFIRPYLRDGILSTGFIAFRRHPFLALSLFFFFFLAVHHFSYLFIALSHSIPVSIGGVVPEREILVEIW